MTANISRWAANGLRSMQVAGRGSGGNIAGFANLTAANTGMMSGMRLLKGVVTAPSPLPGVNRSNNRGEDGYISQHVFDAAPNAFGIATEAHDLDLDAFYARKTLHTIGNWDMHARGGSDRLFQDSIVLLCRAAENLESGGGEGFDNLLVMSSKFTVSPGDFAFQAAGGVTLDGVANRVLKTLWGESIQTAFGDGDDIAIEWWSQYPCTMFCFIGDNSIVAIPTPYAPIDTASTKLFDFAAGTSIAVTGVSPSGLTATVGAAPTSGKLVTGIMETPDL